MKNILILLTALTFIPSSAFADKVYLKKGKILKGEITKEGKNTITLETGDSWQVINRKDIAKILKDGPAVREKEAAAAKERPESPGPKNRILGRWFEEGQGHNEKLEFFEDNTVALTPGSTGEHFQGKWFSLKDGRVKITVGMLGIDYLFLGAVGNGYLEITDKGNTSRYIGYEDMQKRAGRYSGNSGESADGAGNGPEIGTEAYKAFNGPYTRSFLLSWPKATEYCLSNGGRLPSVRELKALHKADCAEIKDEGSCFHEFWSSEEMFTPRNKSYDDAMSFSTVSGQLNSQEKTTELNVRCVK